MQSAKRLAAVPAGQMLTVTRGLFTEPNDYGAGFDEGEAALVVNVSARFRASCDRIEIERLRIIIGEEKAARAAYVRLGANDALVTFPLAKSSTLIVRGEVVSYGELIWHNPGDRFHEWISRPAKWVRIRLTTAALSEAARDLELPAPLALRPRHVIVPEPTRREALLTAVNDVAQLARLRHDNGPPLDFVRSIEPALLQSLVYALADPTRSPQNSSSHRYNEIMLRLEDLVSSRLQQPLQLPQIAAALQISERTLRTCCEEHLGMGLHRYLQLRRLMMVRHHLSRSGPGTTTVAAVARRYGFAELGRFAATYQHAFGELPSTTLARLPQSPNSSPRENGRTRTGQTGQVI